MKDYLTEDYTNKLSSWIKYYKKFNSSFYLSKAGYFDERPQLTISVTQLVMLVLIPILIIKVSLYFILLFPFIFFGYGTLYINLPIRTGIQDCDSACWGFNYHGNIIWIYIGGGGNFEGGRKWKTFTMPWNYEWYRTSLLSKDRVNWYHDLKSSKNKIRFYEDIWKDKRYELKYNYTDSYDGEVIPCTIHLKEMEWRMRWLTWTSLFNKVRKTIEIEFSKEVGKEKGSWKGGCIGCSYELLLDESPIDCIKRMEKERKF